MPILPIDLICQISTFDTCKSTIDNACIIDKDFSHFRKNYLDIYANKIKKWWKYYHNNSFPINDNLFTHDFIVNKWEKSNIIRKKILIKSLIFDYDKYHLHRYPQFFCRKLYGIHIICEPFRTYHVYMFLKNVREFMQSLNTTYCKNIRCVEALGAIKYITANDIEYVGW